MSPLTQVFLSGLASRYDSERQQVAGLSAMARAATCADLQQLLLTHHSETESHVGKLERVFEALGVEVRGAACGITAALLRDCDETADGCRDSPSLNAALIACAQKIEHQEIASYGCLREWALLLGSKETARLIEELLDEEKTADQALIKLAKFRCNPEALDGTVPTSTSSDHFGHEIAMPEALGPGGSYSGRCKVIWHARWDDR